MLFLWKDKTLAVNLFDGLLKYWPFAHATKESLFLSEVREVVELLEEEPTPGVEALIPRLFKRIAKCICSTHVRVVDSALCLFESQSFLNVMKAHKQITYPILVPALADLGKDHWLTSFAETFKALRTILRDIDPQAYADALEMKPEEHKPFGIAQDKKERSVLDGKWAVLH